ncbi:MAG: hypothetical protein KAR79_01565, partial [Simkaniaceae bacterium]|nr:hypothetical protein [Simkaniaceae bacterium]
RAVLRATTSDYKPLEEQTTQTILLYAKALEKKMTEAIESAPIVELEQSDDMPEEISMLALSTAIKMCIDRPWIEDTDCHLNAFFAKKLGMTLQEFNKFEEVTLRLIDYRTHIPKEELRKLQTAPQTTSPADCQAVKVEVKNLRMPIHQAENLERTNQEVLKKHKVIPDKFKTGEALATQKQECLIKIEKLSNELERLSIAALTSSEQKTPSAEDAHNECLMKIKSTQKALSKAFMELE